MRESILLLFFLLLSFSSRVLGQAQDPRPFSGNAYPSSNAAGAGFWIGSKMDDVYAVQGIPEAVQRLDGGAEAWHYGRSTVTITGGRVSAYDNAGKNLRLMAIFPNNVPGGIFPGGGVRQVMPQANVSTPLQP